MQAKPKGIIRVKGLREMLGVSKASIDRWEKSNDFPKRIKFGKRSIGWLLQDIEEWLTNRAKAK